MLCSGNVLLAFPLMDFNLGAVYDSYVTQGI